MAPKREEVYEPLRRREGTLCRSPEVVNQQALPYALVGGASAGIGNVSPRQRFLENSCCEWQPGISGRIF
jgi:hypothetical protein